MSQEKPEPRYAIGFDISTLPDGTDRTVVAVFDRQTKTFVACGDCVVAQPSLGIARIVGARLHRKTK